MPSFGAREKILQYVTDPNKIERVKRLTDEEVYAITTSYLQGEAARILDSDPLLLALRVIFFRKLIDWASTEANEIQAKIFEFIGSPTFVQYPDFMDNETILAATKVEYMSNHSRNLSDLEDFEIEVVGARVNDAGDVEVLITHNQTAPSFDGYLPYLNFSQERYSVPPVYTIGSLKRNPAFPMRGRGNEMYISMKQPHATGHMEVVINQPRKKLK